jgi:hypothetical protein
VTLGITAMAILVAFAGIRFFTLEDNSSASTTGRSSEPGTDNATPTSPDDPIAPYRKAGWISEENAKPGTTDWHIPDDKAMWDKIQGYADATSINFGESVTLRVSTAAGLWQVSAYRIGWYGGPGGRLVWRSPVQRGVNQPRATVESATKTWSAPWAPSLTIDTDETWPPGQYLLRLESDNGGATFVPLVIRDDGSHSDLLMQSAVATWQAYNGWGGASVYTGNNGRADVVSFDRPYTGNGSGEFLGREFEFIWFVERVGYDVSYWTDIDLDVRGELALNHRGIVIPGHDEYYTVRMRENLEKARDGGVNLGFFGANNIYRRIRLENSPTGSSRRMVNYRDATRDPLNGKNPAEVTTSFREAPNANPESSLIGNYYECNPVSADWVVGDASVWMFEGSGFKNGDRVPKMVGNEYDRITQGVPTPANIQVIAHSPVTCKTLQSWANSTWYSAPGGAGVFSAGTFGWSPTVDAICPNGPETNVECRIVKVTENLLDAFSKGPAGAAHPSVSNLSKFGIPAPRVTTPPAAATGTSSTFAPAPSAVPDRD